MHPARGISLLLSVLLVFGICSAAAAQAQGPVQRLGSLSFAVPDGWQYEYQPGGDVAYMAWKNANGAFAIIFLTEPVQTSGNAEKDFADAWRAEVDPNPQVAVPSPIYDIRGMMGYPGKFSGGTIDNRTKEAWLYVLDVGGGFAPVVVITPDRTVFDALQETVRAVIGSIRMAPLVAVPIKTTITVADLAGKWQTGDASVVSYVNTATGAYVGSTANFYGEYYSIAADGRYTYDFQGRNNGQTIREKSAGIVELGGEFVIFHEQPSNRLTRYRFISYQQGLSGGTLLTLLREAYEVTPSNIALYADRFAREPLSK